MNKKIEILCLVLLGVGLLLVASLVIRSYVLNKPSPSPTKQPSYPRAVYAKYNFSQRGSRIKIPVALKISLKNGIPQAMYIKSLARKRSKLLKLRFGTTIGGGNYVAHDAKGRTYGFYWDKDSSRISHSFSYSTPKGRVFYGRLQRTISGQQWKKLIGTKTTKTTKTKKSKGKKTKGRK